MRTPSPTKTIGGLILFLLKTIGGLILFLLVFGYAHWRGYHDAYPAATHTSTPVPDLSCSCTCTTNK